MRTFLTALSLAALLATGGCSSHNQEKAKEEMQDEARKTSEEAKKAGHEMKQDAKEISEHVQAVVKPDSRSASDKISEGAAKVEDAASHAGAKLDHAALLAKVRSKLVSDAGLSTLTNVDVEVYGTVVTLSGTVRTEDQKKAAELAASQVDGVTRVHNSLTVQP